MAPLALVSSAGSESRHEVSSVEGSSSFQIDISKWKGIAGNLWKGERGI